MLSDEGWFLLGKPMAGWLAYEREGCIGFPHQICNRLPPAKCVSAPLDILTQTASLIKELHRLIVGSILSNQIINCFLVVSLLFEGVHGISASLFYFEHRRLGGVKHRFTTAGLGCAERIGNGAGESFICNDGGLLLEAGVDRMDD